MDLPVRQLGAGVDGLHGLDVRQDRGEVRQPAPPRVGGLGGDVDFEVTGEGTHGVFLRVKGRSGLGWSVSEVARGDGCAAGQVDRVGAGHFGDLLVDLVRGLVTQVAGGLGHLLADGAGDLLDLRLAPDAPAGGRICS